MFFSVIRLAQACLVFSQPEPIYRAAISLCNVRFFGSLKLIFTIRFKLQKIRKIQAVFLFQIVLGQFMQDKLTKLAKWPLHLALAFLVAKLRCSLDSLSPEKSSKFSLSLLLIVNNFRSEHLLIDTRILTSCSSVRNQ